MRACRAAVLFICLASGSPALAQATDLTESPQPGDCSRYSLELTVSGHLIFNQEGRKEQVRLEARAKHVFTDRTLTVADGIAGKSVRHYTEATAAASVAADRFDRKLAADRKLIIAQRSSEGLMCYALAGPLSRDELDLITEHFNPQCLAGLLPGKGVNIGDTWAVSNAAAQAACLFDGLIKNSLVGKLTAVTDGIATFTIEGTAEGIEDGARITLAVNATGSYDLKARRVVALSWKQNDDRDQGPVNPASKVSASITLKREPLAQQPPELADAALAALPKADPPASFTQLRYTDDKGRYQFVYPREWHITGQTDTHLVMRLLDKGEFVAQATVTAWKKADVGKHATPDEFKKAVAESPGWVAVRVLEDGELPIENGRWLYRLTAEGRMDDLPVIQSFHLLAGSQGDQVVVTFSLKPEKVKTLAGRDLGLVTAIEFGVKK